MKNQKSKLALVGALAALAACATPDATGITAPSALRGSHDAAPAGPDTIRLGYFSATTAVTVAQVKGFFKQEGLVVREFQTPSSPAIFTALRNGQRDIILTQIDNVFNYRFNASNPIGGTFDAVAFMGQDGGNGASLVARRGITSFEELRGGTVAVDSPNSGFAFVLYGIMRAHGLEKGVDYNVVTTGGTPFRYNDLLAGKHHATILNAGYQFRAEDAGLKRMGELPEAANPFMGSSAVARRDWLDAHPDVAVRFISAYLKAVAYIKDPANEAHVMQIMTAENGGNASVARRAYQTLISEDQGVIADGDIDRDRLLGTATLRDSFGGFDEAQNLDWLATPASGVFDLSYVRRANTKPAHANGL